MGRVGAWVGGWGWAPQMKIGLRSFRLLSMSEKPRAGDTARAARGLPTANTTFFLFGEERGVADAWEGHRAVR